MSTVTQPTANSITLIREIQTHLQQLIRESREAFKNNAREYGLTYYQASTMLLLIRSGGETTMSAVAEALHMSPSTVTSIFDALVARGLVVRSSPPEDRRSVVAVLTDDGRKLGSYLRDESTEILIRRFGKIPPESLAVFENVLSEVLA